MAKIVLIIDRHGAGAFMNPAELSDYLFRDAVVAVMWTAVIAGLLATDTNRKVAHRIGIVLLAIAAVYVGVNIGFFRSFSTPLNRQLIGMAGGMGDLGDSAKDFVTLANGLPLLACLAAAIGIPIGVPKLKEGAQKAVAGVGIAMAVAALVVGPLTEAERPALGLDRNAVWEAAMLPIPQRRVSVDRRDWDVSAPIPMASIAFPDEPATDLSEYIGTAEGMSVVLVVLESTSARYLGAYGAERDAMPRVSALADNSLVFDSWYAPVGTSMKCMFSYLCSMYPYPDATSETYVLPRVPCRSLPEVLDGAGHRGTFVTSARFAFNDKTRFLEDRGYESLWDSDSLPADESMFRNNWGLDEEAALGQMLTFLDEQPEDEPFFLTYVPIFPHHPYALPPEFDPPFGDGTPFERYLSGLAYTDQIVGRLYDAIEAQGRMDDTLFVVIGDHGEPFDQHPGNRMHSNAIYEENVHVPAIVHHRGLFPEQLRVSDPGEHVDLAPTLVDFLGLAAPDRWQGVSMLRGERDMARFFTDYSFLLLGLRDGDFKYIHDAANHRDELYDLSDDPFETRNIADEHPELVEQWREHVLYAYQRQIAIFEDYPAYLAGNLSQQRDYVPLENVPPTDHQMGWGKLRPDLSPAQKPLTIRGVEYADGLGTHAPGFVLYELGGEYAYLRGAVGRDYAAMDGEVAAEIWVDGIRVFESGTMTRFTRPVEFNISLEGAQTMELVIISPDDSTRGDHVDWVDVRLY